MARTVQINAQGDIKREVTETIRQATADKVAESLEHIVQATGDKASQELKGFISKATLANLLFMLGFVVVVLAIIVIPERVHRHAHPADWCEGQKAKAKTELEVTFAVEKAELTKDREYLHDILPNVGAVCLSFGDSKHFDWVAKVRAGAQTELGETTRTNGHVEDNVLLDKVKSTLNVFCQRMSHEANKRMLPPEKMTPTSVWGEAQVLLQSSAIVPIPSPSSSKA